MADQRKKQPAPTVVGPGEHRNETNAGGAGSHRARPAGASGAGNKKRRPERPAASPRPAPMPSMVKPGGANNANGGEENQANAARLPQRPPAQSQRSSNRPSEGRSNRPASSNHSHSRPADAGAHRGSHGGRSSAPQGRPTRSATDLSHSREVETEQPTSRPAAPAERPSELTIGESITVRELSVLMGISPIDIIKELMNNGVMANINQQIDFDTAAIVASELGFTVVQEKPAVVEEEVVEGPKTLRERICEMTDMTNLQSRPPVVTVLGHVDHGKTTLLDAIRHTDVVDTEAGGITQRIGAYQVEVAGKKITFLDTPGHQAFTAMRARGAQVTDLAVLVVAADDGVMPQTREAIDHARAAKVPILVALNKIDKPNANPDLVKQQLADIGLVVEDWGGDVICVPISAKMRRGIDDLLENILLVTEVAELKANPNCPAVGTVVEAKVDKSKGVVVTLLIQNGTLRVGDLLVIDTLYGRVRAMFDDKGQPVKEAPPSMPVAVLGLSEVPPVGEVFEVVESEREARAKAEERLAARKQAAVAPAPVKVLTLDDIASQIKAGKVKELNIVLKADVQGSLEPIIKSLEQLGSEDLRVHILHYGTGNISESDIMLAAASKATVIGFAVDADNAARKLAEQEGVEIRRYDVIYNLIEQVDLALRGLLEPVFRETTVGKAEVRAVFRIPKVGKIAGCMVTEGMVTRDARVRLLRNGEKLFEGAVHSLKRFTEDVKEVAAGFECGIGLEGYNEIEVGDVLEFFKKERVS